jgi:DME family drug/metabolite transporter
MRRVFPAVRRSVRAGTQLTHTQGVLLVATAAFVFSFNAWTFRATDEISSWQFLFYRAGSVGLAMAILLGVRFGRDAPRRILRAEWRHVAAGLVLATTFVFFLMALARTTAATVLLMEGTSPFWAALVAWLWLDEKLSRLTIAAMIVAAIGLTIMVGSGLEAGSVSGVVLAAALCMGLGLYSVLIRSAGQAADPAVPAFIAGLAAFLIAALVVLDTGVAVSLRDGALAVISGGVLLGVGLPIYNIGHRAVPAAEVTLLLMIEVVLGTVWIWIWPGETPSAGTLVGGAIVTVALVGWATMADAPR